MERLALVLSATVCILNPTLIEAFLADRSRVVKARGGPYRDNGRPLEGPKYRNTRWSDAKESLLHRDLNEQRLNKSPLSKAATNLKSKFMDPSVDMSGGVIGTESRDLGQLTGCCSNYKGYYAADLCGMYGQDCDSGGGGGSGSQDEECAMEGLSFVGISFSVNTANGNPYSYQICDQFPMENIIDRNYDYVMSMDEDGWLVGGGYKTFDYSGKMPYIDSSHTELLRIGSMDPNMG